MQLKVNRTFLQTYCISTILPNWNILSHDNWQEDYGEIRCSLSVLFLQTTFFNSEPWHFSSTTLILIQNTCHYFIVFNIIWAFHIHVFVKWERWYYIPELSFGGEVYISPCFCHQPPLSLETIWQQYCFIKPKPQSWIPNKKFVGQL